MEGVLGGRYAPLETLRASIFGEILLCVDAQTQEEVVVKTVDLTLAAKRQSRASAHVQEDARAEVDALTRLRALGGHSNVIALRDCFVSADSRLLCVVLEYCDGGDLLDACVQQQDAAAGAAQSRRIDEYQALGYLRDVLAGLRFLHANGIAHRDLSLENILLRGGRAVIADFGLCALRDERPDDDDDADDAFLCSEIVGKHYYMAPEVVSRQKGAYDPRLADVWSLGVAFFILVTSSPPFEVASMEDSGFRFVAKHGVKAVLKAWGLAGELSDPSQDLLERMLHVDVARRISLPELLRHPAVTGFPTSPVSVTAPL